MTTPVPAGEVAITDVADETVTLVAGVPPNVTAVAPVRLVPAITTVAPPMTDPEAGLTDLMVGATPTSKVSAGALIVLDPTTDSENLYLAALLLMLAGTVTLSLTAPLEHGMVTGRPVIVGFEEKAQLVALDT